MAIEREVKLSAPPAWTVPDLDGCAAGLEPVAVEPEELTATYYDTADLRLTRAGFSLRHRTGKDEAGWTLKLPDAGAGGNAARVRGEISVPGGPDAMPAEVLALVRARVRSAPLEPVGRLVTRRARTRLVDASGEPVIEIDDDDVSVLDGGRVTSRFREIEVEQTSDVPGDALVRVVGRLREAGAGDAESASKIVRALGPRALEAPELPIVVLDGSVMVTELVRASIVAATERLLRHDPGVRTRDDPEDVHQARVATRRLRSDLRTYRRLLDPEWTQGLRDELQWIAGELGGVRDADVLDGRLSAQAQELAGADAEGVAALLSRLAAQRQEARAELRRAIDSDRYLALLDRLHEAALEPKVLRDLARVKAADAVPDLVRRPWKHLAGAVAALDEQEDRRAGLHQVRIRAKRLRYALEAVAPVAGKPARKWAAAVEEVQEVLGDMQDAVVAEAWLRSAAAGGAGASEALVAGQLVAVQRHIADERMRHWEKAWKRASSKKRRAFLR